MVSQRRISEQRRMVTIVCIFRERRNESSLPPPALPGCQKQCARNQLRCDHNELSDYFLIYQDGWFRRRRAHAGGPLFWRTVPQIVAVTKIGVAMRWGAWWRLLDCTWSRAISQ
jgi:hypothetical protein